MGENKQKELRSAKKTRRFAQIQSGALKLIKQA